MRVIRGNDIEEAHYALSHLLGFGSPYSELKGVSLDNMLNELQVEMEEQNCSKVLVSSEYFIRGIHHKGKVKRIREIFKDFNVKIIVYLRRQDEYLISGYYQGIKTGSVSSSFDEYLQQIDDTHVSHNFKLLKVYSDIFGYENIEVKTFAKDIFYKNRLIDDFLQCIGIELDETESIDVVRNISLNRDYTEFLRLCNKYIKNKRILGKVRKALLDISKVSSIKNEKYTEFENSDQLCKVMEAYYAGNKEIEQLYLNCNQLFKYNYNEVEFNKYDELSLEKILLIWHQVIVYYFQLKNEEIVKRIFNMFTGILIYDSTKHLLWSNKKKDRTSATYKMEEYPIISSRDVEYITFKDDRWLIKASGNDPYFVLPAFKSEYYNESSLLQIKITAEKKTIVQVYYSDRNNKFDKENVISKPIEIGENTLVFEFPENRIIRSIRVDPGSYVGIYYINEIAIYSL